MMRSLVFPLLACASIAAGYLTGKVSRTAKNPTADGTAITKSELSRTVVREQVDANPTDDRKRNDLASALASAMQQDDYLKSRVALYKLINEIPISHMGSLVETAKQLPRNPGDGVVFALVEQWLKVDQGSAVAWIKAHPKEMQSFDAWAQVAPMDALTALLSMKKDTWHWGAGGTALEKLAGKDPAARVALLASLPASRNRDRLLAREIEAFAETDPGAALKQANATLSGKDRTTTSCAILTKWAATDIAAAVAEVGPMLPDMKAGILGSSFVSEFTLGMAKKDPTAALEFALSLPEELRRYPLISAASAWAKTAPADALAWSLENGVDVTRRFRSEQTTDSSVLEAALRAQPREAIEWLTALPEGAERQKLIATALGTLVGSFGSAPSFESDSPVSRLFFELPKGEQVKHAGQIASVMTRAGISPEGAEWSRFFPDRETRARATASAVGVIFSQSASRADAMLAQIPAGAERDLALKAAAAAQGYGTPEAAVQRAMQIGNKEMQQSTLDELIPRWLKRDESGCRAWLDSTKELPPSWVADWLAEAKAESL